VIATHPKLCSQLQQNNSCVATSKTQLQGEQPLTASLVPPQAFKVVLHF